MFANVTQDKSITEEVENPDEAKESDKIPIQTSIDSLRICLFCNKETTGVKKCLDHMRIKHSFFINDVDCLINLKGLLTYIAERIHLGQLCLFCSRNFRDGRRCQQHMLDKRHCLINLDDEHEYEDFYDFSKTYVDSPYAVHVEKPKKEAKEGDDEWEDNDFEDDDECEVINEVEIKPANVTDSEFSIITDSEKESPSK
jgi:pre-60S factor REI1